MARKAATASSTSGPKKKPRKWSAGVMKRSDALDLEEGVFTKGTAREIAGSLKRSADRSRRRKGTPFQSAMSMLNFHINRAGKALSAVQKSRLERAKEELRKLFGKAPQKKATGRV
jgi:hypothetical protein